MDSTFTLPPVFLDHYSKRAVNFYSSKTVSVIICSSTGSMSQ